MVGLARNGFCFRNCSVGIEPVGRDRGEAEVEVEVEVEDAEEEEEEEEEEEGVIGDDGLLPMDAAEEIPNVPALPFGSSCSDTVVFGLPGAACLLPSSPSPRFCPFPMYGRNSTGGGGGRKPPFTMGI